MMKAVHKTDQRVHRFISDWIGIVFVIGIFVIRACFVFRASGFGFK